MERNGKFSVVAESGIFAPLAAIREQKFNHPKPTFCDTSKSSFEVSCHEIDEQAEHGLRENNPA